jgi:hypothetical protein
VELSPDELAALAETATTPVPLLPSAARALVSGGAYKESFGLGVGRHWRRSLPNGTSLHLRWARKEGPSIHWDAVDPTGRPLTHVLVDVFGAK